MILARKQKRTNTVNVKIRHDVVEVVKELFYLGSNITHDRRSKEDTNSTGWESVFQEEKPTDTQYLNLI